jgi:hypothetical protein
VDGSFRFTITNDQGNTKSWTVDLKKSPPYIGTENTDKVDVELVLKGEYGLGSVFGNVEGFRC